jgi:HlyD family secretion protein
VLAAVAIGIALALAFRPTPVPVDLAAAARGPMEVTVNEDGRTRVKDRYTVSAPVAGTLARTELHPGDSVRRGDVVARLVPMSSPLLDPRAATEAEARVSAAQSAVRQAATAVERARVSQGFAAREVERQRKLVEAGAAAAVALEQAELEARLRTEELASAEFGRKVAASELQLARAALLTRRGGRLPEGRFDVASPVDGRVLAVMQESEGVVQQGTPLLEIGDPRALEAVVDVLTGDAVSIRPGAKARIERWGGDSALRGRVRLVEPSAFTRVSSLGVEEQRVNVLVDFDEPPERLRPLGDGYRVEASIVTWASPDVLRVPEGAVFRTGPGWSVFVADDGAARMRGVEIGRRNGAQAQITGGLRPGERVVVYPGDDVQDGTRITGR